MKVAVLLCACIAWWFPPTTRAQSVVVTRTPLIGDADPGIGARYRKDLVEAWDAVMRKDPEAAWATLRPVLAYCSAQQQPDRDIVSVADAAEYDLFMSTRHDGKPTEWIDIACPSAYHAAAFLHADKREWQQALVLLEQATSIAPYFADAHAERGFIFNQMGNLEAGLESYRAALALAQRHPRSAYVRPMALRGIGWALIEKGDLQGARLAYEQSLELEPGNELAEKELAYISQLESAAKPGDAAND